ncbi:PaaI family thioesterase [Sphingomonas sp. RS6]
MSTSSDPAPPPGFDPQRFFNMPFANHGRRLGIGYRAHGPDWAELELPYQPDLVGQPEGAILASGPILALMDMAASVSVWLRAGTFKAHATLDLRIDYLRPARGGQTVVGRGECYRLTRSIAFVRGQAHDGDPSDPLAHVAGTFMATEGYW